jgi:hypothetical protein
MANPILFGDVNRLPTDTIVSTDLLLVGDVSEGNLNKATVASVIAAGSGVTGPASSTDNAIARFDGITGLVVQNSATTVADTTGTITFTAAAGGITLKQGANGRVGTFVLNGATPVTVSNTSIAVTDAIVISLNTVGGTVGAVPAIQTITASTGFTVAGTASDTSTYNYAIIKNAA